ncbi:MAG TPA: SPFH domain-containing protein [Candidatus Binataceae bacterium]|nr:SPFH domain-containing protein [Candidatus Binataceae bacterium]
MRTVLWTIGLIVFVVVIFAGFTRSCDLISAPSNAKVATGFALFAILIGVVIAGGVAVLKRMGVLVLLLVVAAMGNSGCTKVEPGWAGIRVKLYGSQRGVQDYPVITGRVWYNPWTEEIYQFPTFMQNVVWTAGLNEGAPHDESFTANSQEGVPFNFDVGVSYQIDADMVPHIFLKFREDANTLTNIYVRNQVRDFFSIEASKMPIMQIVGPQKQVLLERVLDDLHAKLGADGIRFDNISIVGKMRLPPQVEDSINAVIEATQRALEAQNKVAQSTAEAEQRVAEANGIAQSTMIRAKAQADANQVLNSSLTPMLIQYEALQKWNGTLPQVTGSGGMPFVQLTPPAAAATP